MQLCQHSAQVPCSELGRVWSGELSEAGETLFTPPGYPVLLRHQVPLACDSSASQAVEGLASLAVRSKGVKGPPAEWRRPTLSPKAVCDVECGRPCPSQQNWSRSRRSGCRLCRWAFRVPEPRTFLLGFGDVGQQEVRPPARSGLELPPLSKKVLELTCSGDGCSGTIQFTLIIGRVRSLDTVSRKGQDSLRSHTARGRQS